MEIISEELIPSSKARELIEAKSKEAELKYEQKNSLEIMNKFSKIETKAADELIAELKKVEKLRERQVISIVDFLPEDKDDLRAVLGKDYSSLTDEEITAVLNTVKKYI